MIIYWTKEMRFIEGEVIRIISPDTDNLGSLIPIPMTMDIEGDWDPDTLTLRTNESIDYASGTIVCHMARYEIDDRYVRVRYLNDAMLDEILEATDMGTYGALLHDRIEVPIMPVVTTYVVGEDGHISDPNTVGMGIIIVDGVLYPMRRKKSHIDKAPLEIPTDVALTLWQVDGGIHGIHEWVDDLDRWLVRLYDFGYAYTPSTMYMDQTVMYRLLQNRDIIYKLLVQLDSNAVITTTLRDTKVGANNILATMGDDTPYHILAHTCPDYMAWLFTPGGWYHYGYQTDSVWLFKQDRVDISIRPRLREVLLDMVNTMTSSGYELGTTPRRISYDLPTHIKEALATINQYRLRVVLAGGFVVTQSDYDFFILDGDTGTARDLASMLRIDMVSHQFIMATDMHSILDVLYSFDLSHTMIAHDGRQFHITPEFMTFTSAGLSLMVLPVTRDSRLEKTIGKGYRVVYTHAAYEIMDSDYEEPPPKPISIDGIPYEVMPEYIYIRYDEDEEPSMHNDIRLGRDIDMPMHTFRLYMDDNGISYGYRPLDPDTLYYIEYDDTLGLLLAREVLDSTPLAE